MKRLILCSICLVAAENDSSQIDSLKQHKKLNLGGQIGGQLVAAYEQNWVYYTSYDLLFPFYSFGIYLNKHRHTFDINVSNNSTKSKDIIPFVSYYYKFNKTKSKIDLNASARLYSYFSKIPGHDNIKYYTFSENAFCYGLSILKTKNRLTGSFEIYNYFTFSSKNKIYTDQKRKLPLLNWREWSLDMLVELKIKYRLTK